MHPAQLSSLRPVGGVRVIIYPAIDLRGGRCVRLMQGDPAAEVVFADDPVHAAQRWAAEGAEWLHVVNLDGALGRAADANVNALKRIMAAVTLPVQFGGGLRTLEDMQAIADMGVERFVLGTVSVRRPEVVSRAIARFGAERVAVGIDARAGLVATHGWAQTSEMGAVTLATQMRDLGVQRVVYTDIGRDGMLAGPNLDATLLLARATGLRVIASGGVASLDDLRTLAQHCHEGIEGVIVGMALYRGAIQLKEALRTVREAG